MAADMSGGREDGRYGQRSSRRRMEVEEDGAPCIVSLFLFLSVCVYVCVILGRRMGG